MLEHRSEWIFVVLEFHKNLNSDDVIVSSFLILLAFFLQSLRQREIIIILCPDCDISDSDLVIEN